MLEKVVEKWRNYRYRFVPWLALNMKDRLVHYSTVMVSLRQLFCSSKFIVGDLQLINRTENGESYARNEITGGNVKIGWYLV